WPPTPSATPTSTGPARGRPTSGRGSRPCSRRSARPAASSRRPPWPGRRAASPARARAPLRSRTGAGRGAAPAASGRPAAPQGPRLIAGGPRTRIGPPDLSPPSTPTRLGDFEVVRRLGGGAMGVVFEARQLSLNRPVALKMIRAGLFAEEADLRRFRIEAEAVAPLDHPPIVPIYGVWEDPDCPHFHI